MILAALLLIASHGPWGPTRKVGPLPVTTQAVAAPTTFLLTFTMPTALAHPGRCEPESLAHSWIHVEVWRAARIPSADPDTTHPWKFDPAIWLANRAFRFVGSTPNYPPGTVAQFAVPETTGVYLVRPANVAGACTCWSRPVSAGR